MNSTLYRTIESQHPNILFELEHPTRTDTGLSLSLLDFTVTISNNRAAFQFYRKPARRDTFMHFDSHLPKAQKEAVVINERARITARCSDDHTNATHQQDFDQRLLRMNYPPHFQRTPNQTRRTSNTTQQAPTFYLELPFTNDRTEWKIKNLFRRQGINIRLYRRSTTLFSTLRPKRTPPVCQWPDCPTKPSGNCFIKNVVYKLTCNGCLGTYVGQTSRELHTRIRDHILGEAPSFISISQHVAMDILKSLFCQGRKTR